MDDLAKMSNRDLLEMFGELYAHALPAARSIYEEYAFSPTGADVYSELMMRLDYYDAPKKLELVDRVKYLEAKVIDLEFPGHQ